MGLLQARPQVEQGPYQVPAYGSLAHSHPCGNFMGAQAIDAAQQEGCAMPRRQLAEGRNGDGCVFGAGDSRFGRRLELQVEEVVLVRFRGAAATHAIDGQIGSGLEEERAEEAHTLWLVELQDAHVGLLRNLLRILFGGQTPGQKLQEALIVLAKDLRNTLGMGTLDRIQSRATIRIRCNRFSVHDEA